MIRGRDEGRKGDGMRREGRSGNMKKQVRKAKKGRRKGKMENGRKRKE